MIALLAAAVAAAAFAAGTLAAAAPVAAVPTPARAAPPAAPRATLVPAPSPSAVVAKYRHALAALKEPRVFAVEYRVEQTGTHTLEQTHRIFRSGNDERDETLTVNGNRSKSPLVRIFHGRRYRYTVSALAPQPAAYAFAYAGPHRDGKHDDYVFDLTPKGKPPAFAFTQVTIDGMTFLPQSVSFATPQHAGRGSVVFARADRYWVARAASAQAGTSGSVAREQIAFSHWRFPPSLPQSTFAMPRPLPAPPPGLP